MLLIESSKNTESRRTQLILDKLTIPGGTPPISRPRLLSLVEKSVDTGTCTILSARAGGGKTLLAVDFARHCNRAVAWYKVDASDGELKVFFEYLIASIEKQRPGFGRQALVPSLELVDGSQLALISEGFVYELLETGAEPLLIVIEDIHLVGDSDWLVFFLRRVLPLLPSEVHMLITSRTMPPAPLWRMRSKQTLAVIDEDTLGFTRQEAIELFETHGLSSEQACIALDHTHGRPAALTGFAAILRRAKEVGERAT